MYKITCASVITNSVCIRRLNVNASMYERERERERKRERVVCVCVFSMKNYMHDGGERGCGFSGKVAGTGNSASTFL